MFLYSKALMRQSAPMPALEVLAPVTINGADSGCTITDTYSHLLQSSQFDLNCMVSLVHTLRVQECAGISMCMHVQQLVWSRSPTSRTCWMLHHPRLSQPCPSTSAASSTTSASARPITGLCRCDPGYL